MRSFNRRPTVRWTWSAASTSRGRTASGRPTNFWSDRRADAKRAAASSMAPRPDGSPDPDKRAAHAGAAIFVATSEFNLEPSPVLKSCSTLDCAPPKISLTCLDGYTVITPSNDRKSHCKTFEDRLRQMRPEPTNETEEAMY